MDDLTEFHGMLKVETVGPVYMIASGLPTYRPDHCAALVHLALDICDALEDFKDDQRMPLQALMGIHCGPVIGGVVGVKLPRYRCAASASAGRLRQYGF